MAESRYRLEPISDNRETFVCIGKHHTKWVVMLNDCNGGIQTIGEPERTTKGRT
jgi:hypothetical protein